MASPLIFVEGPKAIEFTVAEPPDSAAAQQAARRLALTAGFSLDASEEIALATAELASNLLKHAGRGVLTLRQVRRSTQSGIEIQTEDNGPGITDVEQSFADGYSTAGSLGYGMGTVNRLMDEMDIISVPDSRTSIVCRRWTWPRGEVPSAHAWDVGVLTRSHRFAAENGDAFIVKSLDGELLVGLIDGLGHGALAQKAALAAQNYVQRHYYLPLDKIFVGVGRACQGTRGAVMALARFLSPAKMTFASVGNIEARVCGRQGGSPFIPKRGILGIGEARASIQEIAWDPHWALILHSDGLRTHWQWDDFPGLGSEPAKMIASRLMRALATDHDDATVLAVKCETA